MIYGDGGNAGYDAANPNWRFNEFTSGFSDSNFRNGDPEQWVINSAPLVNSGEAFAFYWPEIADPNPVAGLAPDLLGRPARLAVVGVRRRARRHERCRRTRRRTSPATRRTARSSSRRARRSAAVTSGRSAGRTATALAHVTPDPVVREPAGQPDRHGLRHRPLRRLDLVDRPRRRGHGHALGGDRRGPRLRDAQRRRSRPGDVVWHRIDNSTSGASPTRYPSGIYVDPNDTGHAWISYSGYNANTPATPGHVFDVRENGPAAGSGRSRT